MITDIKIIRISLSIMRLKKLGSFETAFITTKFADSAHKVKIRADNNPKSKKLNMFISLPDYGFIWSLK